jgi:glycosyltransferase involved in cell wall biosynthesis
MARVTTSPGGLRVLHVIDSLRVGGAESLLATLTERLGPEEGVDSAVLAFSRRVADPALVARIEAGGVPVRLLPVDPLYDPRLLAGTLSEIRRHGAAVVHSHLTAANVNSRIACALLRRPLVTTVHTIPGPAAEDSPIRQRADRLTAHLSTRIVAPSPEIADGYVRARGFPRERVVVIPNAPAARPAGEGFDRRAFRAEVAGDDARAVVLCVSRLEPEKAIEDLVEAAALLTPRVPGLRVLVAGDGGREADLRETIAARGLEGVVRLLGRRADVGRLLAAADAFCLPSRYEGLPLSLLEAFEAGLPSVATRVGGVPGLVTDGEALLCAPSAPAELAEALGRILGDPGEARRLGAAGAALVAERYSARAMTERYAELYRALARTSA